MILYLDTETYCDIPLANGVYAYAEEVEITVASWAIDDEPVTVCDLTENSWPEDLADAIWRADVIVMHNSGFDRVVLLHGLGIDIPVAKIHDTAVQALSHGLPASLDKLCKIFKVPAYLAKLGTGRDLIQIFCKPTPKNQIVRRRTRITDPKKWAEFLDYAGHDILAMRWLYQQMPRWNYPTREHELWQLDQKINDRGFLIDHALAFHAVDMVRRLGKDANAAARELTEGRLNSTRQRDKLIEELLLEYGVALPDMQSGTIERRIEDPALPPEVRELLANRLMISTSSTAKYNKVLKGISSDGRLRGSLSFSGAMRTKRWSGKLFQPQNLPRPDMKQDDIDLAIDAIKTGAGPYLLDDPTRCAWNAIRGLIIATTGCKLVQADLAGIEARILPWLAGEGWKLQVFRDQDGGGPDVYTRTAGRLLGIPVATVTKEQRQSHGKVVELACGYGGAFGAFLQFAKIYGVDMEAAEIHEAVRAWRMAHPRIADWDIGFWTQLDVAARQAIHNPGTAFAAGEHIHMEVHKSWMRMHLPSGGFLSYAAPRIIEDPRGRGTTVSYMGVNNYTKQWERITTYGGKLSADATQATARELLAANLPGIESAGYPIVLLVHDEVVTETPDCEDYTVAGLVKLLTRRPVWIDDKLPLAAGGFEAYRYKKGD